MMTARGTCTHCGEVRLTAELLEEIPFEQSAYRLCAECSERIAAELRGNQSVLDEVRALRALIEGQSVSVWGERVPPVEAVQRMRSSLPPDDASRAVRLIGETLNATETARGLLYATAAGRCRVMLAVQSVQAVVLDQVRAANGRPVDHCRHGWHRGTHVHTGRR